ncbi:hypothetical protein [Alkalibacillus flavidus]
MNPKSSWELYMSIKSSDDIEEVETLMSDSADIELQEKDINYIQNHAEVRLMQMTVIDFHDKAYLIMTDPSNDRMEITTIEELPNEVRETLIDKLP